jgi:hypothetical protein
MRRFGFTSLEDVFLALCQGRQPRSELPSTADVRYRL